MNKRTDLEVHKDVLDELGFDPSIDITLKPYLTSSVVRGKIEAAFKRNADLDADHVHATAEGGNVTLRGHLPTWSERESASRVAWNADGVIAVNNEITVGY